MHCQCNLHVAGWLSSMERVTSHVWLMWWMADYTCLVHKCGISLPVFLFVGTRVWLYQRVQVHVWNKYLGLNLKMTPKVLYKSLDPKMWVHLNNVLTLICNTKIWGVNLVLNHLFLIQPHSDIWIIISRWRL